MVRERVRQVLLWPSKQLVPWPGRALVVQWVDQAWTDGQEGEDWVRRAKVTPVAVYSPPGTFVGIFSVALEKEKEPSDGSIIDHIMSLSTEDRTLLRF